MDNGSFRAGLRVLKLNPAFSGRDIFVFQQKQKRRVAGSDLVAVLQPLLLDRGAVHQRAVSAVEVAHAESSLLRAQHTMFSRNGRIDDRNSIRSIPPDGAFTLG